MVANTGSRWSSRQMRSTFATGGCGAMSAKRHPALSAWLAIRTKALSPRASQKDRLVRSSSSTPAWTGDGAALRGQAVGGGQIQFLRCPQDLDPGAGTCRRLGCALSHDHAPLPSPSGRRYRGQYVPVNMAPHSARSQGRKSPPGRVHHRETNQCGPRAPASGYSTGPAGSDSPRRRPGAGPWSQQSHAGNCRPAARWQAIG